MREHLRDTLIQRDGLTPAEADELMQEAREELLARIEQGELPFDFCEEFFGLEPDYLDDLI